MAYLVIARKWRPQTFEDVVGQPHVIKTLQNAITTRRIAHAYLFTGSRGVGKTSVARILAKALNCEQGPTPHPCNQCSPCRDITNTSSVDVLEIDGASNRGIEEIRELRENVRYLPASSKYKVYIIDEVHMLTGPAFNALLKTLEEPPKHVVFTFATTAPHKIPITILSRCQRFDFRRIAVKEINEHLQKIVKAEGFSLSHSVLSIIAREADGSMRDAESLLEQVLTFSSSGGSDTDILELLGIVDQDIIIEAAEDIVNQDIYGCLKTVQQAYERGYDIERFCQKLANHFRNVLILKIAGKEGKNLIEIPDSTIEKIKKHASAASLENLQYYCHFLMKGIGDLRYSSLPRLSLEMLLIQLCKVPQLSPIPAVISKLREVEQRILSYSHESISEKKLNTDRSPAPPLSSRQHQDSLLTGLRESVPLHDEEDKDWEHFIEFLRQKKAMLGTCLEKAQLMNFNNGKAELYVPDTSFEAEKLKESGNQVLINELASEFFQKPVRIAFASIQPEQEIGSENRKVNKQTLRKEALSHPAVELIINTLGGKVVDVLTDKGHLDSLSFEKNGVD